jgi:hypothetical protein
MVTKAKIFENNFHKGIEGVCLRAYSLVSCGAEIGIFKNYF